MKSKEDWIELLKKIIEIAQNETGLLLTEKDHAMIESRLIKRIYALNMTCPKNYLKYLNAHLKTETPYIISLVTTHYTAFFREYFHFEDLENKFIGPIVEEKIKNNSNKKIRVLSTACSQGQEVYSLSMFFHKLKTLNILKGCDYEIIGCDVDESSVNHAKNGVYYYKELMQSPIVYIHGNWSRGLKDIRDFVKPKPHIKAPLKFEVANLLNFDHKFTNEKFDVIFCRNVLIYFNESQIKTIIQSLLKKLSPFGVLVLGISESIMGLNLPVRLISNNIYQHENFKVIVPPVFPVLVTKEISSIIRVLCVDDSPTILGLLRKILSKENGFEVVATAKSAAEARDKLRENKVDVMTLDIHMEGETGLDYLQKDFVKGKHPPVIILSSIERDGTFVAQEAIKYGASDYIEKPDLKNMELSSNEIRFKVKTIIHSDRKTQDFSPNLKQNQSQRQQEEKTTQNSSLNTALSFIRVLIVDDSPTILLQMKKMLSKNKNIEIIGSLSDPREIEPFILKNKPDVITLDINMPHMNGVEVVQKIISKYLIPTIMVSSLGLSDGTSVMEALDYGAIDYFQKPSLENMEEESLLLIEKVVAAKNSKVRVHREVIRNQGISSKIIDTNYLIAIGSSTGGTEAIKCILELLPENIPPIVIVQHIPAVFSKAFADRLNGLFSFAVVEAQDNQVLKNNCVYIAPGDNQMRIIKSGNSLNIKISQEEKRNNHRPSVDVLFESIAELKLNKLVGILLTGMGGDGAVGLKKLKEAGAQTIAQNKETCVVFGMPNEAIKLGGAMYIEPIEKISDKILSIIATK